MLARNGAILGIKVFVAISAPVILYWQDFVLIANEALRNDLTTYIIAVPLLLSYILYRVRKTFAASASPQFTSSQKKGILNELSGVLLCLLAYMIKWYGSYTFQPLEYHIASLPLFVAGVVLIIFNVQALRVILFPIAFLVFLIPPPVELAQQVGATLATFSSQAAYTILKLLGLPISLIETYGSPVILLSTPTEGEIPFVVDIACSGLYSLIGFIIFSIFTTYLVRNTLYKKMAVLAIGFPIIYCLNIIRIIILLLIGYYLNPGFALDAFHIFGGWILIFLGTLILLVISEKFLKIQIFETNPMIKSLHNNEFFLLDDKKQSNLSIYDFLKMAFIFVVSISLLSINVPVFSLTKSTTEVFITRPSGEELSTDIFPKIDGHKLEFVYRDTDFEKISGQDFSVLYRYIPKNISEPVTWVGLEIGLSKSNLHPWEFCLINYPTSAGWTIRVEQLDLRDIHLTSNPPLSARYFAFQRKDNEIPQVVLYWYTKSVFRTVEGYTEKWAKISVIQYSNESQQYKTNEDKILPIATAIANFWQPVKSWSWVALVLAKNGGTFAVVTSTTIVIVIIIQLIHQRQKRKIYKEIYTQISDNIDKAFLQSIKASEKKPKNYLSISENVKKLTVKELSQDEIKSKLLKAEEEGLIERAFIKINDEPILTWKANY